MRYAIVFSSKTGNTKLLAETLHDHLPQEECCYFGTPDPAALEADTLYVGLASCCSTKAGSFKPPTPQTGRVVSCRTASQNLRKHPGWLK